jgi:hypothetical protein
MATPGETACHDVADCGSGPWGNIPVDATTQYVDSSYAGGGSDGSSGKPWTTLGDAVNAATAGAIVAVAAGSYRESVDVKVPVAIWGRCPSLVEIVGSAGASGAAVTVEAAGSEVHQVALTGDGYGALVDAPDAVLGALWVHDTVAQAVAFRPGSAGVVRGSLVENTAGGGVLAWPGTQVAVDASVVRDTLTNAQGQAGHGIDVGAGGSVTLTRSLLERNQETQIALFGAAGSATDCVIRDGLPSQVSPAGSYGIAAYVDGSRSDLHVRATTLERNGPLNISVVGSDATLEDTLVRDTLPDATCGAYGSAVSGYADPTSGQPADLTLRSTLVERAHWAAVVLSGGTVRVGSSVVRDTLPQQSDGLGGVGVAVDFDSGTNAPTSLSMQGSLIERNEEAGVSVDGAAATIAASVIRNPSYVRVLQGTCVSAGSEVGHRGSLTVAQSVLSGCTGVAISAGNVDLVVDRTVVSDTTPVAGFMDYAVAVGLGDPSQSNAGRPTLAMTRTLLARSVRSGVEMFWGVATLSQTWIRGVGAQVDGSYGDGLLVGGDGRLTASNVRIEGTARAGLSMFDRAQVSLTQAALACDAIPLDGEDQSTFTAAGPLSCDCGAAPHSCQVLSSGLQAPPAIVPAPPVPAHP